MYYYYCGIHLYTSKAYNRRGNVDMTLMSNIPGEI